MNKLIFTFKMKKSKKSETKQIQNFGEIIISSYEGKKLAKMKDSSFLFSAVGDSEEEAIEKLKKVYSERLKNFQNSD